MLFLNRSSKVVLALALILFSSSLLAAKAPIYSHKFKGAVKGVDVVAYYDLAPGEKAVKGSKDFTYEWNGAVFRFANEENRQRFMKDPEAYMPQYGGYCAFAVSHNFVTSPRPDSWEIVDGKLYLNNNKASHKKWKQDLKSKIAKADENWPDVLDKKKRKKRKSKEKREI